jgi:hypothetical protein
MLRTAHPHRGHCEVQCQRQDAELEFRRVADRPGAEGVVDTIQAGLVPVGDPGGPR